MDPGYLKVITSFIESNKNRRWSVLEFGSRGFIGILYRASSLKRLSQFVRMYYWIWPVDVLFRQFNDFNLYGNPNFARLKKPLFRHVGRYSTLEYQIRGLEDVGNIKRIHFDADNPPAQITTTINKYYGIGIMETYRNLDKHGTFWGIDLKLLDNVTIIFSEPINISKVVIETGGKKAPEDIIGGAILYRSAGNQADCGAFEVWKRFDNTAKPSACIVDPKENLSVKCLRLTITKLRKDKFSRIRWLRILEIAVWVLN